MGEVTVIRRCPTIRYLEENQVREAVGVDSKGDSGVKEHLGLTLKR